MQLCHLISHHGNRHDKAFNTRIAHHLIIRTALDPMEFQGLLHNYPHPDKLQLEIGEKHIFSCDNKDFGVLQLHYEADSPASIMNVYKCVVGVLLWHQGPYIQEVSSSFNS